MLPIKPFLQTSGLCGPACLKIALEYFGVKKTEKYIDKKIPVIVDWFSRNDRHYSVEELL